MTYTETIESLRCCFGFGTCSECKVKSMMKEDPLPCKLGCKEQLGLYAAELIERLTAENAKAEAERDALLEKKRWILVSKKEPEYDMPQLAMTSDGEVLIANYAYGEWFDTWGQDVDVTHWMPLPEAPEDAL